MVCPRFLEGEGVLLVGGWSERERDEGEVVEVRVLGRGGANEYL